MRRNHDHRAGDAHRRQQHRSGTKTMTALDFFECAREAADDFFDVAVAFERVDFFTGIDGPPWRWRLEQRRCPGRTWDDRS